MVQASDVLSVLDMVQERPLSKVPQDFIAPPDGTPIAYDKSAPMVDLHGMKNLSEKQHAQVVEGIARASAEWGFFQVINHGIDTALLAKAQEVSVAFFELPTEERLKFAAEKPFMQDGYGSQTSLRTEARLWRDFIFLEIHPNRNLNNWPALPQSYREITSSLSDELIHLTQSLVGFMSEGLGMPTKFLEEKIGEYKATMLNNYYPDCPEPDKAYGTPPHSDVGFLSTLVLDQVPGLQVLKDGAWVMVEPVPGAVAVNISDQLEVISNGCYQAVYHRAAVNGQKRMSIGLSYHSANRAAVQPIPELVDNRHHMMAKKVKPINYENEHANDIVNALYLEN